MPMAISFVGASIIWKFVYAYRGAEREQIGLLNQIVIWLGGEPKQFLLDAPLNTFLLIVIMVWIQTGFAMVVLSAAIKAHPGRHRRGGPAGRRQRRGSCSGTSPSR